MKGILLIGSLEISLPLQNPVLIFSLILFIILFAPIILNKFKIPHLIGLIIAGMLIGPHGLNLMLRDSSIILLGTVGLLYIMFLAGLEIDMADFKKNSVRSIVFGLYTFIIPITAGTLGSYFILQYDWTSAILLGSLFASHTLLVYPIISQLGVQKNRVVGIAVGGTMITDILALLVLAIISAVSTGKLDRGFIIQLSGSIILFTGAVMILFPIIGRWFFKNFSDSISQYIFVIGMLFLAAFLAELAGVEAIIGAFLAGLSLNRLVPQTSALMNRIEFVGNALFIPFFLIGVGMIIDLSAFVKDFETVKVALFMTITATVTKFSAAWLTQKTFKFSIDERRLLFGLSNAHVAATLAIVLVGYNIIIGYSETGEPLRLLNESVLNGTILMILVTCTIASFAAQKGAKNIVVEDTAVTAGENQEIEENILIPLSNIDTTEDLINLSLTIKSKKNKKHIYALNVIPTFSDSERYEKVSRKILEKAIKTAAAADVIVQDIQRYDFSVPQAIADSVKEFKITDLVLGVNQSNNLSQEFIGELNKGVLKKTFTTTLIYKAKQPLATLKRHFVIIPEKAEKESGFPFWLIKVWNIARNTGDKFIFLGSQETLKIIREVHKNYPLDADFREFTDWYNFLYITQEIKKDDNLIIIMSRKNNISYSQSMKKIPEYLNTELAEYSFILIYPLQFNVNDRSTDYLNPSMFDSMTSNLEKLDDIGKNITKLFTKH